MIYIQQKKNSNRNLDFVIKADVIQSCNRVYGNLNKFKIMIRFELKHFNLKAHCISVNLIALVLVTQY